MFTVTDFRISLTSDYSVPSIFLVFEWEFLLGFSCFWLTIVCWGCEGEKIYPICSQIFKSRGTMADEPHLHLDLGDEYLDFMPKTML